MSYRDLQIAKKISTCFAIFAVVLSSCGVDVQRDPPARNNIKTFSEIVGLTSVNPIELPGDHPYSRRRLPVNIDSEHYRMELSGDVKSHPFCKTIYDELEDSKTSIIGILQAEYNPDFAAYYDGQFFPFPDIPKILKALHDVPYERLPWQNVEENIGEIYYKRMSPHKTYGPSGRVSRGSIKNIDLTLENFLSDLPDNFTGYPVFQMYEFTDENYIFFRVQTKTLKEIRQLDQNYSQDGGTLPSNFLHEGIIDINFKGGKLDGFGEDVSFAEFLGNGGVYYLNAKTGRRHQNTLSVISVHFFNPSIRPGGKPYRYEQISGPADNPRVYSSVHSGPVSHKPICEIEIHLKSPPKFK